MTERILDCHLERLSKPRTTFLAFSDVYGADRNDAPPDFDAVLATEARSLIEPGYFREFGIGADPGRGAYAASLVVSLQDLRTKRLDQADQTHPEIQRLRELFSATTSHVIINTAPRSEKTGKNGTSFYLAITDNGVAIWVTPLELLKYLGSARRIIALYEVPNESHEVFPDGEQFRSSVVPSFRFYPELLIPVFQYETRDELLGALKSENPPQLPEQQHEIEIAYIDRFGNVRCRARSEHLLSEQLLSHAAFNDRHRVGISLPGKIRKITAHMVRSLAEIPDARTGVIYPSGWTNQWFQIVRKTSDPNNPNVVSAADSLTQINGGEKVRSGDPLTIRYASGFIRWAVKDLAGAIISGDVEL